MRKKCVVLFSNGLDSRLAVKIIKEKNFDIFVVYFKLPFSKDVSNEVKKFCKKEKVKLKILNCCKGNLFVEYLEILKKSKFGRGTGFNPCIDCKIFMFKKTKKFADFKRIKIIASGEVIGQRPMSQTIGAIKKIEGEIGFNIFRPLNDFGIFGRSRKKQIQLAKKFGIDYPPPAGGCLLCESVLRKRFDVLIKNNLINEKNLGFVKIGRHFFWNDCWFVVARNERECEVIEKFKSSFIGGEKGKPAVYFNKKEGKKFAEKLQDIYKTGASEKEREKFDKEKL